MIGSIPLCGDHSLSTLMAAVSLFIRPGTSKQRLWGLQWGGFYVLPGWKCIQRYKTHVYTVCMNTNTQRTSIWSVLHCIPVVHSGCYEDHFYSCFVWNVFVASDVCIPFIIVSFGGFFLFLSMSFMFGFVLFWFCIPGSLQLLSALRYLSQDNKLNNNHHNTRWI